MQGITEKRDLPSKPLWSLRQYRPCGGEMEWKAVSSCLVVWERWKWGHRICQVGEFRLFLGRPEDYMQGIRAKLKYTGSSRGRTILTPSAHTAAGVIFLLEGWDMLFGGRH